MITAGVPMCEPSTLEYCSKGRAAKVEQIIFLARAIVGTAIACWRLATDWVNTKGLNDAVLLNGAGVEAASTVTSIAGLLDVKMSRIPIGHIIRYCLDIILSECLLQIRRVSRSE